MAPGASLVSFSTGETRKGIPPPERKNLGFLISKTLRVLVCVLLACFFVLVPPCQTQFVLDGFLSLFYFNAPFGVMKESGAV